MSTAISESAAAIGEFEYSNQSHSWNWDGGGEARC